MEEQRKIWYVREYYSVHVRMNGSPQQREGVLTSAGDVGNTFC